MIKLFDCNDTVFNISNGDMNITALKCNVKKGDIAKKEYYVDLETDIKYSDVLVQDKIILIETPKGEQPFRLNNPQKKSDRLIFKAYHIFYDTENYVIQDAYPQDKSCEGTLEWVIKKTDSLCPFTAYSDLTGVKSNRYVNKSLFQVVCEIADEWGGKIEPDGMSIRIVSQIGEDRGVSIRYGKNLTYITAKEDWKDVCTKLYAVGYNGITLDSPIVSQLEYGRPYSKVVEFYPAADISLDDEAGIKEDLQIQARAYLNENQYPKVSYKIKSHIENIVDVGDKIEVQHDPLNINIMTKVVSYIYNSLTKKFNEIEFGNYAQSVKSVFRDTSKRIDNVEKTVSKSYNVLKQGLEDSKNLINQYLCYGYRYSTESAEYYLNAKNPDDATQFMIISLGGIGFGTKEVGEAITEAEYVTAWTIDGSFNANFIKTGKLNARIIEVNGYDKNIEEIIKEVDENAKSAKMLALILSKEFISINTDNQGNDGDYSAASFYVICQYGNENVSVMSEYTVNVDDGITGVWHEETRTYNITDMSIDSGKIAVTATYDKLSVSREIIVSKIKTGATGPQGPKGDTGATGAQGPKGDTGTTGAQGPKGDTGADGTSSYTHIRYSINSNGNPMVSIPTDETMYIGIYTGTLSSAPTSYSSYTWSRYTGKDGEKGDKGDTGATGPQGPKGDTGATGAQGPKGDTGATGPAGAAATTYYLTSSTDVINRMISKVLSPKTITFNAYCRTGTGASTAYAGRFIIQESSDGITWTTKYTSSSNESSKTYTPSASETLTFIKCTLYLAGGTSQVLDIKTVSVIFDSDTIRGLLAIENNTTKIDGGNIATKSIKAKSIDIEELFAQTIEATGSITGAKLVSLSEREKIVISNGQITLYCLDIRGEGNWVELGTIYPASIGDIGATGAWTFDSVSTKSGADLDEINSNLNGFAFGYVVSTTPGTTGTFIKTCKLPNGFSYENSIVCAMIRRSDNALFQYVVGEISMMLGTDNYIYVYVENSFWCNRQFKVVLLK